MFRLYQNRRQDDGDVCSFCSARLLPAASPDGGRRQPHRVLLRYHRLHLADIVVVVEVVAVVVVNTVCVCVFSIRLVQYRRIVE